MTMQDWGALGDMVGGIAVVASLIYLAIQIRQNTQQIAQSMEAAKLGALERSIESANRIRELMILHTDVADLFLRGLRDYDGLAGAERFRFDLLMSNTLSSFQGAYLRTQSVGGDPLQFEGTARLIDSLLQNPGARAWLANSNPDWRPQFREFIEQRLAAMNRHAER